MRALITGGAGYIGSLLTASLISASHQVIVVDRLLFGGDPIIPFLRHPLFTFHKRDVAEQNIDDLLGRVDVVYHLAALVGFPACRDAGPQVSHRYNVHATVRVFEAAERAGVDRFVFASTYSNYGFTLDDRPVTEDSALNPQSIYAETKIAAETFLRRRHAEGARCSVIIPRFTTLFGISPRTRFDLIVNQFVLEALTRRRLIIYEGDFRRSFVHVSDVVRALVTLVGAPLHLVRGEVFNVGNEQGNYTKSRIVELVTDAIPGVVVEQRALTFGGDMRDVTVSCQKIRERIGFEVEVSVPDGILEVRDAIVSGLILEPSSARYRNHAFSVQ